MLSVNSTTKQIAAADLSLFDGIKCFFQGMRLVYAFRKETAKYYIFPMLLALIIVTSSWVLFWHFSDYLVRLFWAEPSLSDWFGLKHLLWRLTSVTVFFACAGFSAIVSAFLFYLLTLSINDFLSEKIETILGTWKSADFSLGFFAKDIHRSIVFAFIRFLLKIAWLGPLFILSLLIPVVGNLVYAIVGGYFLCKYTAMDYVDWCAARRGLSWKDRLELARKNRFAIIGFGAAVVLSFTMPLVFIFVWPAATAGGTVLFLKIEGVLTDEQINTCLKKNEPFRESNKIQ